MTTTPDHDFTRPAATSTGPQLNERAASDFEKLRNIPDPDLAPVPEKSDLELIAADLKANIEDTSIVLPVKRREGYSLRFDTNIPWEHFEKWRKVSKDRRATNGMDVPRLASLVIANKCIEILKDGKVLVDDAGDPLTFGSDEIRSLYGTPKAAEAVKLMIGRDSDMTAISDAVVTAAGWGDEVSEEDPTPAD